LGIHQNLGGKKVLVRAGTDPTAVIKGGAKEKEAIVTRMKLQPHVNLKGEEEGEVSIGFRSH